MNKIKIKQFQCNFNNNTVTFLFDSLILTDYDIIEGKVYEEEKVTVEIPKIFIFEEQFITIKAIEKIVKLTIKKICKENPENKQELLQNAFLEEEKNLLEGKYVSLEGIKNIKKLEKEKLLSLNLSEIIKHYEEKWK